MANLWPALNYNAAEPEKGREVDCMEPFNSALSLKHTVTTVAETDCNAAFRDKWEAFSEPTHVSLQVTVEPLGGALKSFHQTHHSK